ncbi:MAG: 50S ribosomal protein L1 [Gammaproteobacteria bacterium]|jgi:large subunit ribosomal protein L1|nr:50S ribosomal protein L1 [Gammaproteobacteria bacterium]
MAKKSKRYLALLEKAEAAGELKLDDAVKVLKEFNNTGFDQTIEIHMHLGVDSTQADQIIRGAIGLPHGIGRELRVVVFAKGDLAAAAEDAGAMEVGAEDLAKKINDGWTDFDVCVASPDMMGLVGPLGKVLGPRGLMPSPRAGTVTPDVGRVVAEYKAGKVEFRNDDGGNLHAVVGRLSFEPNQIVENLRDFIAHIESLKPLSIKGTYIQGISICAAMSPGLRIAL